MPGSESEAFKGVSLFIGIVFTLGSSSAIANIIAGYMMTAGNDSDWRISRGSGRGAQSLLSGTTGGTASASEPTKDLFDLIHDLRHKPAPPPPGPDDYKRRMIAAAPVVTYIPTSGLGIGIARFDGTSNQVIYYDDGDQNVIYFGT